jgi:hypothetical protein
MPSFTLHDIASGVGARLIGVECQHCIRRGVLTAEELKARRGDGARLRRRAFSVAPAAPAASLPALHDALCCTRLREEPLTMVRRRGNPFANALKRLPHKAFMRREDPLRPSDDDQVYGCDAEHCGRCRISQLCRHPRRRAVLSRLLLDTAEKARAMQAWIDASGIEHRPAPAPTNYPQLKLGRE